MSIRPFSFKNQPFPFQEVLWRRDVGDDRDEERRADGAAPADRQQGRLRRRRPLTARTLPRSAQALLRRYQVKITKKWI